LLSLNGKITKAGWQQPAFFFCPAWASLLNHNVVEALGLALAGNAYAG